MNRTVVSILNDRSMRSRRTIGFCAGLITAFSLPPWGWWPLAIVGLAAIYLLIEPIEARGSRFSMAWWSMLGFFTIGLVWMIDLTPPGYVVSVPIVAAIMSAPMVFTRPGPAFAASFPAAIMLGEAWHWVIPFGGVPMGSIAMGQAGGPLLDVARAFGALGLIAAVAISAVAVAKSATSEPVVGAAAAAVVIAAVVVGTISPDGESNGTLPVAVVQGGGELGTRAVSSSEATVFERHLAAAEDVPPGSLSVWPESAITADAPFETSRELAELQELAIRGRFTIVAGLTERIDADFFSNAAVVISPEGELVDRYEKVHLVPFGEYIPLRSLIDPFADLSLIPRTAIEGTGDARVDSPLGPLAVAISFEVYFGERTRDGVNAGGEIILNPTLASSYRTTHVPEQSLASARLRAVESGRWVLQSSTTGYSAIVDQRGEVVARTGLKEARVLSAEAERRTGATWPVRTGKLPITALALLVLFVDTFGPRIRHKWTEPRGLQA